MHLRLPPGAQARREHIRVNVDEYAGLLGRACPAQVYEYVDADADADDAADADAGEASAGNTRNAGSIAASGVDEGGSASDSEPSGGEGSEGGGGDSRVEDVTASGKKFVINSQVRFITLFSRSGPSLAEVWIGLVWRRDEAVVICNLAI